MQLPPTFRILPCGDAALSVEFGQTVDPAVNAQVLGLDAELGARPPKGVIETVPTYRSLFVQYDPVATGFEELAAELKARAAAAAPLAKSAKRWRIPVVYGGERGPDLDDVARRHELTTREVIRRHSACVYRIYMIGFTPGFAYLGGLDPTIATPRRDMPRALTPAGAIMIGGVQACVQCLAAPSGWHILGQTPVRNFQPSRKPVFLMATGDEVVFDAIEPREWAALARAAERGEPVAERVPA
ncbi:MAG: 5-oxoprolinase subunit PxpB [Alphaproteobacteria bacterium]|nr:5-oxoprolinase subunit PxpB [Alphaproteobacteria bacterium]